MTIDEQRKAFEDFTAKQVNVIVSKGNDYANADRLNNFKVAGKVAGNSAEINCLNLIATKVARLGVLLNSNLKPENEAVEDSILDLCNYGFLLHCLIEEKKAKKAYSHHNPHLPIQL